MPTPPTRRRSNPWTGPTSRVYRNPPRDWAAPPPWLASSDGGAIGCRRRAAAVPRATVRAGRRAGRQPRGPDGGRRATAPSAGRERRRVDGCGGRGSRCRGSRCRGSVRRGRRVDAARCAGSGRSPRLPGRAAQPDPAPATGVRPAPRRPARPGLGAATSPGGLPGDQGPGRHAPGAADRDHGGRHRPARDRALLPARDPEHRRRPALRRRPARHRRPRRRSRSPRPSSPRRRRRSTRSRRATRC